MAVLCADKLPPAVHPPTRTIVLHWPNQTAQFKARRLNRLVEFVRLLANFTLHLVVKVLVVEHQRTLRVRRARAQLIRLLLARHVFNLIDDRHLIAHVLIDV
jgi:hypothetical protein